MTLEEAIKHCEEVAEEQEWQAYKSISRTDDERMSCLECAAEHRQLAEWLKKLKKYEEGIEKIKELVNDYKGCDMWDTANGLQFALECLEVNADEESR